MKCPIDGSTLTLTERGGVEIDYCSDCRGVWLDRGELDKIIDRTEVGAPSIVVSKNQNEHNPQMQPRKKKRENFLSDLFDF